MIPRVLLALLVVFATHPAIVYAGHCGQAVRVQKQAVVQYAAQVQQIVHHAYQQQVVLKQVGYVPQYYSVGAQVQQEAIAESITRKVLEQINERLNTASERIDRGAGRGGFTHPGQTVAQHKCATCHTKGSAKVADGVPELFDGLGKWLGNNDQAAAAVRMAENGQMPPKGENNETPPLDNSDFYALKAYLTEATSPIGK